MSMTVSSAYVVPVVPSPVPESAEATERRIKRCVLQNALDDWCVFAQAAPEDERYFGYSDFTGVAAKQKILAYYDHPTGALDLSELSDLDSLPSDILTLPELKEVKLSADAVGPILEEAIQTHNVPLCKQFFSLCSGFSRAHTDAFFKRHHGQSILGFAIGNRNLEICQFFIDLMSAAELNAFSEEIVIRVQDTPLGYAAILGDVRLCQYLVEKGADPFLGEAGNCAMDYAARQENLRLMKVLLPLHVTNGVLQKLATCFFNVLCYSRPLPEMADFFLSYLKDSPYLNGQYGTDQRTLLMQATASNWIRTIPLFLNAGARVDIGSIAEPHMIPLVVIATLQKEEMEMFDLLLPQTLQQSPDSLNAQTSTGDTALLCAVYRGHVNMAHKLLKAGADPKIMNHLNLSTLYYAVRNFSYPLCTLLLAHDAAFDPKAQYKEKTLLEWAQGNQKITHLLTQCIPADDVPPADDSGSLSDPD